MEEYLHHMKTLRSQMNEVEDQAAKISVEEQTHITTFQTLDKDLASAKSETKRLKEDTEQMMKAKGEICSQILEKQRKIASLDSDSYTLAQTLELIQQERVSLSARLVEKSTYYTKVADDMNSKLQQQQDWVHTHRISGEMGEHGSVKEEFDKQTAKTKGKCAIDNHLIMDNLGNDAEKNLIAKLDSAKSKLVEIAQMKSKLVTENNKMKQSIEQLKCSAKDFKTELFEMDIKTLEEEYKALLSDRAGEIEYLQSLQKQIKQLKDISHMVKCACGVEYKVAMELCA
ncbi:hypothetical protein NC652_031500 [Populus alba x Populus x berolinensis]|uniref:Uncharacterized protein n=1 Tax=Populus alba TaxID=43335 RepID=A0ACC4B6I4_POPAL|nr:uncharacterized protein LOC118034488 [Populus alba]KAJ6884515.1 hypothetical protein NC652_031500 [Populus alba x Populus x berolinensis]